MSIYKQQLTDKEFDFLSQLIYKTCGINLSSEKKILLESRLRKRLIHLKLDNFKDYIKHLNSAEALENELIPMIDLVSTNKTDFFREPEHFNFLENRILPEYLAGDDFRLGNPFRVWSAASSTGEEPYTISIVVSEFIEKNKQFKFETYASDISTRVLSHAYKAIYDYEKLNEIPYSLQNKYFLRSKEKDNRKIRVVKHIRNRIKFYRLNLIENGFEIPNNFHVVFCRNVLIYFDKETQLKVVENLLSHLRTGGYLIMGHSETLQSMDLPVKRIESTIYKKL